ncbi:hypothetical protein AM593_08053, partial [Mytilus galloprovincialis]
MEMGNVPKRQQPDHRKKHNSRRSPTEIKFSSNVSEDEEIKNLRETIEELEMDLQGKSQQCNKLTEEVDRLNIELEDANEQIDNLKIELGKCQVTSDHVIAEQKTIIEQEFAEQLADLDRQLNDAKREHTKAVVSLRQLERQTTREKERATEHLNTVEQHYTRQIEGLQQKLQTVESERNLMMVRTCIRSSKLFSQTGTWTAKKNMMPIKSHFK